VLLKPPFLTEREAIEEAIETVKYAFEIGFDAVSIVPVSVHDYSLVDMLYLKGLFIPPWLWSVLAVAQVAVNFGETRIGGLEYYPRPEIVAHNRHEGSDCTQLGWKVISAYNATHNPSFLYLLNCDCKRQWLEELDQIAPTLKERLQVLEQLSIEEYRTLKGGKI
jgi:radical SAM enzyme (TIGR01210 family)